MGDNVQVRPPFALAPTWFADHSVHNNQSHDQSHNQSPATLSVGTPHTLPTHCLRRR